MKPHTIIGICLLVWLATGCSLFGIRSDDLLNMPVDSLVVPVAVTGAEAFTVRVVGVLTNGCQRFDRLEAEKTTHMLELRMLATERRGVNTLCTTDIRWVARNYTVEPPFQDPYEIVARWGEQGELRRLVPMQQAGTRRP